MLPPGRQGVKKVSLKCVAGCPLRHPQPFLRSLVECLFLLLGNPEGPLKRGDLLTWTWKLIVCVSVCRIERRQGRRDERRGEEGEQRRAEDRTEEKRGEGELLGRGRLTG